MYYSAATSEGIFRIVPAGERWGLYINDVYLGVYHTAEEAATRVAERQSGWDVWDLGKGPAPASLKDWGTGR